MKENGEYTDILNKIFICLIIIVALLAMNLIYDVAVGKNRTMSTGNNSSNSESGNTNNENKDEAAENMNSVTASEALKLFDSKTPQVIYIGRPDCYFCQQFLPTMLKVQEDLGFKTNYININIAENMSSSNEDLMKMLDKMDLKTEISDEEGNLIEVTYGEAYGHTPMIIIVKGGKMIDGQLGGASESDYKEFLTSNGVK